MSDESNTQPPVPCLAFKSRDETRWFNIEPNGSVLIGSGGHCKIQLEGDGVHSLHCIVAMKGEAVELRDWNTGCTLVNGVAISDPVELNHGDVIRVCGHTIEAVLTQCVEEQTSGEDSGDAEPECAEEAQCVEETQCVEESPVENQEAPSQANDSDEANETPADPQPAELFQAESDQLDPQPEAEGEVETEADAGVETEAEVNAEVETETPAADSLEDLYDEVENGSPSKEYVYDAFAEINDADESDSEFAVDGFIANTSSRDLDRLRVENEQLRQQLLQNETEQSENPAAPQGDCLSRDQTLSMISRMQDLVTELKRSGQRNVELEEQIKNNATSEASTSDSSELVSTLQGAVESLKNELQSAREEIESLREQVKTAESNVAPPTMDEAQQKLNELQLEVSRERADISRQRAELEQLKTVLQERIERIENAPEVSEGEARVQAMREHLKELHQKEAEEKTLRGDDEVEEDGSIANQLANLIQRVTNDN